jgi:uridine kinase/ribulose-5-phosphate 4-epimerase/fuculose-1-phosphate aldolase
MKLICISGSSGVGKTTVSKLIQSILGTKECLCLSGDDLHRWERNDPMWKIKTHLDPQSNDLEMGYGHLLELSNGNSINRKIYNHDTGKFDSAAMISPRPWVVYEGLHALYHRPTADMATLKIFVDTDETLKTEWKIKRDTKKRGYTEKQVVEMMKRRKIDEDRFITVQKKEADIVIKFTRNRNASISLDYVSVNGRGVELLETVKEFYDSMMDFMSICKWLSLDPALVQGRGGNVSVKSDSGLLIKASGAKMADVNLHHGFCVCNFNKSIPNEFQTEDEYTDWVRSSNKTGFHALLADRVVIHTHPIHLNAILCSKEGKSLIANLFSDMTYEYVEYVKPGSCLMSKISTDKSVFFLENHGLIVTAKDAQEAFETTERINSRCKRWLSNHVESFVDTEENETANSPLFPDAAVFPNEMQSINNYILGLMTGACLTPKFLNADEIESLNNMPSEKYRKALV